MFYTGTDFATCKTAREGAGATGTGTFGTGAGAILTGYGTAVG